MILLATFEMGERLGVQDYPCPARVPSYRYGCGRAPAGSFCPCPGYGHRDLVLLTRTGDRNGSPRRHFPGTGKISLTGRTIFPIRDSQMSGHSEVTRTQFIAVAVATRLLLRHSQTAYIFAGSAQCRVGEIRDASPVKSLPQGRKYQMFCWFRSYFSFLFCNELIQNCCLKFQSG